MVTQLLAPGCPALFDRLTESFQRAVPRDQWPPFCAQLASGGERRALVAAGSESGFAVYHLTLAQREVKLGLALDGSRRISGLYVKPWTEVTTTRVHYQWPLGGRTKVGWGGATQSDNAHVAVPRQQRATDLVFVGPDGKTHRDKGATNADYLIHGAEVLAAADGTVRVVVDGVPENQPGVMDDVVLPGNMIAIEHGPGEFAHYCHLQPGSARVKPGDSVQAGQVIGLVGNSGNSSEPHLHFHVQSAREIALGVGLDPVFAKICRLDGGKPTPIDLYHVHKDDLVGPCPAP